MFKHPKYYKELRKRNKALRSCDAYSKENSNYTERQQSDQAISLRARDGECERTPDSGPKPRYTPTGILLGVDLGDKPQASSKPEPVLVQQSSSNKRQA